MSGQALRLAVALNGYGLSPPGGRRDVLPWSELAELAILAERLGYERIFAPEIAAWEAFVSLTGMATITQRIGLASGVVPLTSRDLRTLAMGALSLQEMSGDRFILGVGSSESVKVTGEQLGHLRSFMSDGDVLEWPAVSARRTPLYLAALGPRMGAVAARVADGAILNWCPPERVIEARSGASGQRDFTTCVYVRSCFGHADAQARAALEDAAAYYLQLNHYRNQFERFGIQLTPGAVVEATCVWGSRDRALARLGEYRDAGADLVVVYPVPVGDASSSIGGTMMALAPDPALES